MDQIGLRELTEEDLPVLYEHQVDSVALEMAAFPSRDKNAFMKHWREKILANHKALKRAIIKDQEVVGYVTSWEDEGKHLVAYWIGREFWGRGIATQALSIFLSQLKLRPLCAHVAKHNIGSIRVLEKCGFKHTDESHTVNELHMTLT